MAPACASNFATSLAYHARHRLRRFSPAFPLDALPVTDTDILVLRYASDVLSQGLTDTIMHEFVIVSTIYLWRAHASVD